MPTNQISKIIQEELKLAVDRGEIVFKLREEKSMDDLCGKITAQLKAEVLKYEWIYANDMGDLTKAVSCEDLETIFK